MPSRSEQVAERARALIGARFRPQGRSAADGLDCVGVAALALGADLPAVRRDYRIRGETLAGLASELERHGLVAVDPERAAPGDIAVFRPGAGQFHLGVVTGPGFVHADGGLRKVVERPLPAPWPLAGLWRLSILRKGEAQWRPSS